MLKFPSNLAPKYLIKFNANITFLVKVKLFDTHVVFVNIGVVDIVNVFGYQFFDLTIVSATPL